jgi:sensor histidine kinase YesM
MQQIRFGEGLRFSIDVPAPVREALYVPVFSLQLLIENAIKHNVLTRERPLTIRVVYEEGVIRVVNNLQKRPEAGAAGGTGLINLRERYRALTGDPVLIKEGEHEFSVTIKAFDYEGSDH